MNLIRRSRTIRPSTRLATSTSYKVNTEKIGANDELEVTVTHENGDFIGTYRFSGKKVANLRSIHFRYENDKVIWPTVTPD